MVKILVYGNRGWIGKLFTNVLDEKGIEWISTDTRADNYRYVLNDIICSKPTHVVSLIGRTHGKEYPTIDYLEQKGKLRENLTDNLFAPYILAEACRKANVHYTYLGSGCIYTSRYINCAYTECFNKETKTICKYSAGTPLNKFDEYDDPNFFGSSYSTVKGITDMMMKTRNDSVLNVRIRMPITSKDSSRNFISKITRYEKICSIPNSMSVLDELLPIMVDMIVNSVVGTFNLCNPGVISHNEILTMYQDIVNKEFTWKNFTIEEQDKILLCGRSNNELDTTKLLKLYPDVMSIKDSVQRCLEKWVL
uniref:NAD dependent epimerase/dehydratase n=1 Tax=Pithovirus LCPAC404 TaxID=2506597 RepID=A0A481ZEJ4_9VIRU|nr:MAG: NAD dependent epimerase/dehydratase [Pithovirus LCPAC404]